MIFRYVDRRNEKNGVKPSGWQARRAVSPYAHSLALGPLGLGILCKNPLGISPPVMSLFAHVAVRRRRIFAVGSRGRARFLTIDGRVFRVRGTVSRKKAWVALLPISGPGFGFFPDGEGGRKRKEPYLPFSSGRGEPFGGRSAPAAGVLSPAAAGRP